MRRVKGIFKSLILLLGLLIVMGNVSLGASDNGQYYMLYNKSNARQTGTYEIKRGSGGTTYIPAIKILRSSTSSGSPVSGAYNEAVYCIYGGQGFGSGTTTQVPLYTQKFDMRNPNGISSEWKFAGTAYDHWSSPSSGQYKSLMWVLDHICVPSDATSRQSLLRAAGVTENDFRPYNTNQMIDMIESAQQAAIWYYSNPSGSFHPADPNSFVLTKDGSVLSFTDIEADPPTAIYKYLVNNASSSYDYAGVGAAPLTYENGFTTSSTQATYRLNSNGTRYLVGPYKINKSSKDYDTFEVTIKDGTNDISDVKIVDANENELSGSSVAAKISGHFGTDFYISVPVSAVTTNIKFNVNSSYNDRTITYRAASNSDQPLAIIEYQPVNNNAESTVVPESPKFDLALRKFITGVKTSEGTAKNPTNIQRTPNVDESKLTSGTTADYKHRKDPVEIETGDIVTYKIRVYNEGSAIGRVTKIVDQLPEGLVMNTTGSITSAKGNSYSISSSGNRVTFTTTGTNNLPAYSNNSLVSGDGYDEITFECKVTATPDTTNKKVLTNIAWIAEEINVSTGETITNQTNKDRDSTPVENGHNPEVENNNMPAYTGKDNKTDLTDSTYYYKGQEDDDDFEKLVLQPNDKLLDLALRKWIAKIVPASESGEITDIRKVIVDESNLKNNTQATTAEYKHSKNAISVMTGDTVFYNIRIYNEGEIAGRATEITDQLPEGLRFEEVVSGNFTASAADQNNVVVFTRKTDNTDNLPAYSEGSLQENGNGHETITVRCTVTATYESSGGKDLTNIAWISKQVKEDGTVVENDLDSHPAIKPDVNKNSNDYKGRQDNKDDLSDPTYFYKGQENEDDDDFEKIKVRQKVFDLALRKFITKISDENGNTKKEPEDREPIITDREKIALAAGNATFGSTKGGPGTTTEKDHPKNPVEVSTGDIVTYKIRVYNEGEIDGIVTKVTDYLPTGLEFLADNETNRANGWEYNSSTRQVTTTILNNPTHKLDAFNKSTKVIDTEDIEIVCKVVATSQSNNNLRNIAAITAHRNPDNEEDVDSEPQEINVSSYNAPDSERGIGEQDDDDYEDLKLVRFDLALRKFITGVNHLGNFEEITNRAPQVDTSKYGTMEGGKEVTSFTYNHTKDPVRVEQTDILTYTIRVYNEGTADGYAEIVKDDIPEGLEFLPEHETNTEYKWKMLDESGNVTTDVKKAKFITTDFLKRQAGSEQYLLKAYSSDMQEPSHQDVKVAFKVTEPNTSDRIITNQAQISKHTDKDGKDITDIDSHPDRWIEGEDDQDVEHIYVKYFDLALRKWVTHAIVIEDGQQKEMATGHKAEDDPEAIVKVELNKKRLENTVVKFRYSIRVTNEGEIAGYATEISDYIPKGLKFNQADNPKWKEVDGKIVTDQLKDTLLQPGQSTTITVLLTWENDEKNMGVMVNVAEISEDKNDTDTPDIDSTPNNKKEGEDDIDDAPVALTVVAGSAPAYIAIACGIAFVIGASTILIKKYVI